MIKPSSIEKVLDIARIDDVIGDFVQLKRAGSNLKGLCPFHNEKTPSFVVSPGKGIYKCFGCGRAGNSSKFIMEHEQLSYPEAIKWLASKYQIEIEEEAQSEEAKKEQDLKDSIFIVNQFAVDFFEDQLHNTEDGQNIGLSYFQERGYSINTIKKFQLGFTPNAYDTFVNQARDKGFSVDVLLQSTLAREKNGKLFDFFRDRVMFTIHNLSGKVIAFAGRAISQSDKGPKYINSPETLVYNKSRVLYGMHQSKKEIAKLSECILVEGYTDVISLHQAGLENVVASSGTALTEDQVRIIQRYTPNITVLFDGDAAGLKASMRGIDIILQQGLNVKVAVLPEGEDPDSMVKTLGGSGLTQFIEKEKKDFILFKTDLMLRDSNNDPTKISEVIRSIVQSIALIPDNITRSLYIKNCSDRIKMDERILIAEVNKERVKKVRDQQKIDRTHQQYIEQERPSTSNEEVLNLKKELFLQERDIIRILLDYSHLAMGEETVLQYVIRRTSEHTMQNPQYRKVFDEFISIYKEKNAVNTTHFTNHTDPQVSDLCIDLLTERYSLSENWEKMHHISVDLPISNYQADVEDGVNKYLFNVIETLIATNEKAIGALDSDDPKVEKFLKKHIQLNKTKMQLADVLSAVITK